MNKHFLLPGKFAAFKEETEISTLLGSCVAIALFDPATQIGGMNHYILPEIANNEVDNPRYGVAAIELLINEMLALGASLNRLQAKVYGGGNVASIFFKGESVGQLNIQLAEKILKEKGIRVLVKDVGGESKRRLRMNTTTFEVTQI